MVSRRASSRTCPDPDTQLVSARVELGLDVRRWLEVGAGFNNEIRSTADDCVEILAPEDLEFDNQTATIFLRATL